MLRFLTLAALAPALLMAAGTVAVAEDLVDAYPATMDHSESGLTWTCEREDVWRLSKFEIGLGKDLGLVGKGAHLALGRHEKDVLWAVVFPDKPVKIASKFAGDGEKTDAILLRLNGHDLGRLFPSKTVKGPGAGWLRARAGRIFGRKVGWRWSTPSGNPTIVPRGFTIVDVDTDAGKRRLFGVNRKSGSVEYVKDFEDSPLPPLKPISKKDAAAALDAVWEAFDRDYAMFVLLPKLDWNRAKKDAQKTVGVAKTVFDAAAVIADMLAALQDLHVWVKAGDDYLPGYTRDRPLNANWAATRKQFETWTPAGENLHWGRTKDGIGYLNVHGLSDTALPAQVDAALEALADTWALVVDLRFNGGGGEDLAQQIAARFADAEHVYGKNRYRNGPKHDQLGPILERPFGPRGPWRYESPVACLWGRKTMSSAESMALMMKQCPQVTTMGAFTAGSSANPRRLELDCGITVNLPQWLDLTPDEEPIERVGVPPDRFIESAPADFTDTSDPVIAAALERLRKIAKSERQPGKR